MSYTRYDVPNESGNVLSGLSLYYDSMYVSAGGTATKTTLNCGSMYVSSGGTATKTTLDYFGSMYVFSSGGADNTTVNSYGRMCVIGGSADNTTITSDGYVTVGNAGLANHTTIGSGASMNLYIDEGWNDQGAGAPTASNTTVLGDGMLYLSSGAVADGINVAGSGRVYVYSGATATGIVAESGARIHYWIALDTVVTGTSGGTAFALSNGKISGLKIDSGNGYGVESGATATAPVVQAGGSLFVYDYGSAVGIIEDGGFVSVSAYGAATFTPHEFSGAALKQYDSATVHSGTTATDTTVSCCVLHVYSSGVVNGATARGGVDSYGWVSAGRVILSGGAIASGVITADELGRVQIANGATITDGTKLVENGGAFVLDEGVEVTFSPNAFGNQTLMGSVTVHAGTTATDITVVSSGGAFHLYEGGSAYNIALASSYYDNCSGVVHSNAVASGLSGRDWTVEGGAVVYGLNGGGKIAGTVSGANATGAVSILNGGRMVSAIAPYIDGMGYGIYIDNGGTLEKSVLNGGYGYVSSGATVKDLTVTAGALYVNPGATVDVLNFSGGTLSVTGGSVTNFKITENVYLYLRVDPTTDAFVTGTMDDSTPILLKDGKFEHFKTDSLGLSIANGGVADDITFENGQIVVSAGGTATNFIVSSGGAVAVSAGGTLTSATFHGVKDSYGDYYSSAGAFLGIYGGEANSISLEGGRVSMTAGTLQDVDVNGGHMWLYGGTAKNAVVSSGGKVVAGYTCALENFMLADYGYMSLGDGAKATGTVLSAVEVSSSYEGYSWIEDRGGYLNVSYGGVASDTTVGSGCQIWVNYGGSASGAAVSSGGYMYLNGYGSDYYGYYPLSWGVADDVTVSSGGSIAIYGGASATNLKLEDGAKATITLVSSAGLGGTLVQGTYAGSAFEVADGHMTDNFGALEKGFAIVVSSGGVLDVGKETRIVSGATLEINLGGAVQGAERITVEQGGCFYIGGGEFTGKVRENGGYVGIYNSGYGDGTPIEFEANTFSGLTLIRQSATVHSGTVASKTKLLVDHEDPHTSSYYDAHMEVYSGGLAYDTDVAGGYLEVYSGGSAFRTVVHSSGYMHIDGVDAVAGDVTLEDAAHMELWGVGASASGVTMKGASVSMTVGSSATATSTVVSGGSLLLYYGASAFDTDVFSSGGSVTVLWGALASSASIEDGAGMTVSSGGTAVDVTVAKGGKLLVEDSGFVSGLTSVGGEVSVGYSATLTGETEIADGGKVVVSGYSSFLDGQATVFDGGTISVESGGTIAAAITVKNGGEVSVGAGGWLTGQLTVETGATVAMAEGSFYSFDISGIAEPSDKPLLNDYSALSGAPEITITVSPYGQTHGTYILADNAAGFDETVSVYYDYYGSRYTWGEISLDSGPVQFGDDFYTLTLSEENQLVLTVGDYIADNGPDGGWNNVDKLWDKKAKKPVDGGIYYSGATILDKYYASPIPLDKPLTIDQSFVEHDATGAEKTITYNNFVGKIAGKGFNPDTDDSDCGKFELKTGARLSFNVTARAAGKFVIYKITEKWDASHEKCTYTKKAVQTTSISVKGKATYSTVSTKAVYLEAGTYFLSMETKIGKKKDTECFYNVELNYNGTAKKPATTFYSDDDNGWNNYLYDKKKTPDVNTNLKSRAIDYAGETIQPDNASYNYNGSYYQNFVGFGDDTDFLKVHLYTAANLSLHLYGAGAAADVKNSGALKVVIYSFDATKKKMKALQTTSVKAANLIAGKADTKLKLLEAGDYYISVKSANAKKGDKVYYTMSVGNSSVFFDKGDGWNDYVYDKKSAENPVNTNVTESEGFTVKVDNKGKTVYLDNDAYSFNGKDYTGFVGHNDEKDFVKLNVSKAGTARFKIEATDAAKIEIWSFDGDSLKMKSLQSTSLKKTEVIDGIQMYGIETKAYSFQEPGEYYLAVTSTNAKKAGNAYYNVTLFDTDIADSASDASALSMPETDSLADRLAITDSLSLGQYDPDVLAGTCFDPSTDKLLGETNGGLLASL
jgi:autotransporter passenger strand-loop-strand repeat protein